MPWLHCSNCHHEYYGSDHKEICDWCNSTGYIIEEKTSLETMCEDIEKTGSEKWLENINKEIKDEKELDNHSVFVYINDKLHLGIASRRRKIEIECGLTNCGINKVDK